jgi:Zn-dependent peptidase ImmA (M78 family)
MNASSSEIVRKANDIVQRCGTRDPHKIADELGIEILYCSFTSQKGAYKVILRNRFMFVKKDLSPVMENIVLLHELGHDTLHRKEAAEVGVLREFNIFDVNNSRMENEANIFAAQIALPDDDFIELVEHGYDTQQIASALNSDVNLVAIKADTLISQGYKLRPQEHRNDFLRYDK